MSDRRAFLRSLASLPLIGGWIALAGKTAVAVPAVSIVSTLQEGLALMRIGGQTVTVDTENFHPSADQKAVVAHFDGSLSIEPVIFEDMAPWYGRRSASLRWREPGPNDMRGVLKVSERIWIVGTVVEASPTGAAGVAVVGGVDGQ